MKMKSHWGWILTGLLILSAGCAVEKPVTLDWPESYDDEERIEQVSSQIEDHPEWWDQLVAEASGDAGGRSLDIVNPDHPLLQNDGKFLHVAHRGGGCAAPEETRLAWTYAMRDGADVLEGDFHVTKDGHFVMSHDASLKRCTNSQADIKDLTLAEIRDLDAAYWFTQDDGESYPLRGQGIQIALLEEFLTFLKYEADPETGLPVKDRSGALIPRPKPIPVILEIKPKDPEVVNKAWELLDQYDLWDVMVLCSNSQKPQEEIRRRLRSEGKGSMTVLTIKEGIIFTIIPSWFLRARGYEPPAKMYASPYITVNRLTLRKADKFGLMMNAWTVNSKWWMNFLINEGCNAIQTDDCQLLAKVRAQHDL